MSRLYPPLGPVQFCWWDRLRRLPRLGFVVGGAFSASTVTVLFHAATVVAIGYRADVWQLGLVFGVLLPVFAGAFFWTAVYMEARYGRTLGLLCHGCGYPLTGLAGDRCPECGQAVAARSEPVSPEPTAEAPASSGD